jgi:hypothetical protein
MAAIILHCGSRPEVIDPAGRGEREGEAEAQLTGKEQ